jgi:hypothetical protein
MILSVNIDYFLKQHNCLTSVMVKYYIFFEFQTEFSYII